MPASKLSAATTDSAGEQALRLVLNACLILLFVPVVLFGMLLAPWGRMLRTSCVTRGGGTFFLLSWRWHGWLGRWLNHSALAGWPRVLQLLSGNLAWVGLHPHPVADALPSPELKHLVSRLQPGVFSLWGLRHRTATDHDDLWATQLEYARHRSLGYDCKLLINNFLAMALHPLPTRTSVPTVVIDTLRIDNLDLDDALGRVVAKLSAPVDKLLQVCFINVATVNLARRDVKYRKAVNHAELNLPEGLQIRRAADFMRTPLLQRLDRRFFAPKLWATVAERQVKVYLLGGESGSAAQLAQQLKQIYPGLCIVGTQDLPPNQENEADVLACIRSSGAELLVTGLGLRQEEPWIAANADTLGVKVAVALGDAFVSSATGHSPHHWGSLFGHCNFTLAVFLQRWLGSVKPLREFPVVVRPGDANAPGHAVVLVTSQARDPLMQPFDVVPALLPVGALRALAHVMEMLAEKGCRHVDLVTDVDVLRLRETLGHGARWGLSIEFHLVQDEADMLRRSAQLAVLADVNPPPTEPRDRLVWLVDAAQWLPEAALGADIPTQERVWAGTTADVWSGWACLSRSSLRDCFQGQSEWSGLVSNVMKVAARSDVQQISALGGADLRTLGGVIAMTLQPIMGVLEPASWRQYSAEQDGVQGEVWVSRQAQVDPGVQLIGPVYIGPGCHISSNAVLGPGVILGRNVRVGADMALSQSVVLDGVCLDGGLDIKESLVHERGIANFAWQVVVPAQALGSLLTGIEADAEAAALD